MKKFFTLLLTAALMVTATACGQTAPAQEESNPDKQLSEAADLVSELGLTSESKDASGYTVEINSAMYSLLDFEDTSEYENAVRGLIDAPEVLELKDAEGKAIWSQEAYSFLNDYEKAPDTVNPSLWENSRNNHAYGLFEVCEGIYQVRGYDMANLTLIEGDTGWIVFDPLMSVECTHAAMQLVEKNLGKRPIQAVIISHCHVDHYGGAFGHSPDGVQFAETGFLDQIAVEQVYINGVNMENDYAHELILYSCEKHEIPVATLKPGDLLHIGDVKLEVLWPNMDAVDSAMTDLTKDVNDTSLVIRMDYGEHSSLFTGDLYVRGESWLLNSIDDVKKLDVDFLKIPHHGRNTSSSAAFVNAVTPELAVFTGRAAQGQVDEVYAAANATFLNEWDRGYIHVTADQDGIMTYEPTR